MTQNRVDDIVDKATERLVARTDQWFHDGYWSRAIQGLAIRKELFPADGEAVSDYGWLLEQVGQGPKALEQYRGYEKIAKDDPDRSLMVATYYFNKKEYDKLPGIVEPTLNDKCHPNNFRILGLAYQKLKKWKDAERIYVLFLKYHPNEGQAKKNLEKVRKMQAGG